MLSIVQQGVSPSDEEEPRWGLYDVIVGSDITHGDDHADLVYAAMLHFLKQSGVAYFSRYNAYLAKAGYC
jgi:hypothetical protein